MTITNELLRDALVSLSHVPGMEMKPQALIADVVALAKIFDEPDRFTIAINETVRELELLVSGKKTGHPLVQNHEHILSSPYQSIRVNGMKADLRIAYDENTRPLRIRSFGHRFLPESFYKQLELRKKDEEGWA